MSASKNPAGSGPMQQHGYHYQQRIPAMDVEDGNEQSSPMIQRGPPPGGAPPTNLYQPKSLHFWMILICNFLALFLVALDRTIISTASPSITDQFHSPSDVGWYGSAYMLTTASAQLIFGRIYKFYNMKWTFLSSVVVFELGSAICGAAPSSVIFIIGRAIAGLGSAGIFSGAMLIMIPMIPLHKRPMFQGMFGMIFGIASVLGPLVGGAFTSNVSWRWCFYINLPVGAITLLFMIFFWNPPSAKHMPTSVLDQVKRLDPIGMFFFLPSLISLLLALQWGGSTYAWSDGRIIGLFVVFLVLGISFCVVESWKPETATVPPRIIKNRTVFFGASFTFFLAASMLMMIYFVPIWFQTVKGVSPLNSGISTLPLVLSLVVSSILSGTITTKIGYYVPSMIFSPALMAVGEGLMSTWQPDSPASHWIAYQFLAGFGLGFGMQAANLAVQTVLPKEDIPTGVAIIFFVQQLGGAVFTSVGQSIMSNMLVSELSGTQIPLKLILNEGITRLRELVHGQQLVEVINAYNSACSKIFLCAMGVAFVALLSSLGMEWKSIKKGKNGPPPGGMAGKGPMGSSGSPGDKKMPGGPPGGIDRGLVSISQHSLAPPEKMTAHSQRMSVVRGSVISFNDPLTQAKFSEYEALIEAQSRRIDDLTMAISELKNRPSVVLLPPPQAHGGNFNPYSTNSVPNPYASAPYSPTAGSDPYRSSYQSVHQEHPH